FRGLDALIEPGGHIVDERQNREHAGTPNGGELAKPKNDRALPLLGDHEGLRDQESQHGKAPGNPVAAPATGVIGMPYEESRDRRQQGRQHDRGPVRTTCAKIVAHDDYSVCLARAVIRSAKATGSMPMLAAVARTCFAKPSI